MREIPFSDSTSFYESVKAQISEHYFTEQQKQIAEYLIGSLDDDGLLRKPMDGLIDDLFVYEGIEVTEKEVLEVLKVIQEFDPAGIGARNLQECLLIQIRIHGHKDLDAFIRIVYNPHFPDLMIVKRHAVFVFYFLIYCHSILLKQV